MTAKEALLELVGGLSDEDAQDAYEILLDIFQEPRERPPVSAGERASVLRGLADADAGRTTPHEEFKRRFGSDRWR